MCRALGTQALRPCQPQVGGRGPGTHQQALNDYLNGAPVMFQLYFR